MFRALAIAMMFALAVPTLAAAEEVHHPGPGGAKAGGAKAGPVRQGGGAPAFQQRRATGMPGGVHPNVMGGHPVVGGVPHAAMMGGAHPGGAQFSYRGHMVNRVHMAPFLYPHGYGYRHWGVGVALPAIFLAPAYYYTDWAALGLTEPEPGYQWVRYGPDLLLVNVDTGQVVDAVYGAFY